MYGAELEAKYLLTDNDRLSADVQYLHGRYTSFKYAAFSVNGAAPAIGCTYAPSNIVPTNSARFFDVDCSGKPTVNSPGWVVNLGLDHTFNLPADYALVFSAHSKYESSRYLTSTIWTRRSRIR